MDITIVEIQPSGEFGGHIFEYESNTDLFKCVNTGCGIYEIVARANAREQGIGEITPCLAASGANDGSATASEGTCPHGKPLDDDNPCDRCLDDYRGMDDEYEEL